MNLELTSATTPTRLCLIAEYNSIHVGDSAKADARKLRAIRGNENPLGVAANITASHCHC
jgi:hypothetical protein